MKTKINLTLNSKLVPKAKRLAKENGKSVSQIVEELLQKFIEEDTFSFTDKWLGKLEITDIDDNRTKYLKNRYQL